QDDRAHAMRQIGALRSAFDLPGLCLMPLPSGLKKRRLSQMRIGAAAKIDEEGPAMTPTFLGEPKTRITPVPQMFMARVTKNTVAEVRMVRDSVSLIEMLTMRSNLLSRRREAFSRMRSNTTMVSFIE